MTLRSVRQAISLDDVRRQHGLRLGVGVGLVAAIAGMLLATVGPIYTSIGVIALAGAVWAFWRLENALSAVIFVVVLLPYATLPFKVVLTLSFLDIAVLIVYTLYLLEWMTGQRRRLAVTPIHAFVILFVVLSLFSFVAGLRYAGLTSNRLRQFSELALCVVFGLLLVDMLQTEEKLQSLVRVLILAGIIASIIGIVLWILPDTLTDNLLSRLSVIGYPNSGVIHYIEDNPELAERAIGTSVDPNSFGGILVIIAAITAAQLTSNKPAFGRRWLVAAALGLMVACLGLTFSRGAMFAFAVALFVIGWLSDRRLILLLLVGIVVAIALPFTQAYVERFFSGIQGVDLATQMRFGEYKDALILIQRYPLIGVGFTGAPDIDIYLGVSSLYLTIASNMGLVGLLAFLSVITALFAYAALARNVLVPGSQLRSTWLGLIAAMVTILVGGIFDHYFFNLEFFHASTMLWMCVGLLLATTRIALTKSIAPFEEDASAAISKST